MILISNNQFFSQNNRFDFLLFLVTTFYCTLRCNTVLKFYKSVYYFFYKEDLLTYKNLQKYATQYIDIYMYNMKYNKIMSNMNTLQSS